MDIDATLVFFFVPQPRRVQQELDDVPVVEAGCEKEAAVLVQVHCVDVGSQVGEGCKYKRPLKQLF